MQPDSEIMLTLDLDFRLMLCSREEFSFRNFNVSMLVGTKQLYAQKWFKTLLFDTPCLDDNVKSKENRQNFKICKLISLSISFSFSTIVCLFFIVVTKQSLHNVFGSRIWLKMSYTSASLKTDVTPVQTLRLIILDLFYRQFLLQWLAHISWCNRRTIKAWCGAADTYKTIAKFILHSIYTFLVQPWLRLRGKWQHWPSWFLNMLLLHNVLLLLCRKKNEKEGSSSSSTFCSHSYGRKSQDEC